MHNVVCGKACRIVYAMALSLDDFMANLHQNFFEYL